MSGESLSHRSAKALAGGAVLAALVAAAVYRGLPSGRPPADMARFDREISGLPGFAGLLALEFDGIDYTGQGAARILSIDVAIKPDAGRDELAASMRAAGDIARRSVDVYQKLVVTGYRRREELAAGLAFAARAVWLAPELVKPLDGWIVMRLPDGKVPPERALDGIYASPKILSSTDGLLVATVNLETERRARPSAGIREILASPLVPSFDYDDAFTRSPALKAMSVTILAAGGQRGRFSITRSAWESADVTALLAKFAKEALAVSAREMPMAEKYAGGELFTPLLFDKAVSAEDKAEIRDLEARRRAAEDEFYKALFSNGVWDVNEPDS